MTTVSKHLVVSVDIDRHSDAELRRDWLPTFREQLGCRTPRDIRQHCQLMRMQGFDVFPACDHHDARGYCKGHPADDDLTALESAPASEQGVTG